MKKILEEISNPYEINNFEILLNIYLSSHNRGEFYENVVSYYQDRDMNNDETEKVAKKPMNSEELDNQHWKEVKYNQNYSDIKHRIYINSSLSVTKPLIEKFMEECEKDNIPFLLKYITEPNERSDGIVIGSSTDFYKKQIEILRKIAKENPQLIESCGTPLLLTANLDGWMGLADECSKPLTTYTQYIVDIFDMSFMKFLVKNPEIFEKLDFSDELSKGIDYCNKYLEITQQFKKESWSTEKYNEEFDKQLSSYFMFQEMSYQDFGNIVEDIKADKLDEFYKIFKNECDSRMLDSDNPAFNKDTIQQFINMDKQSSDIITPIDAVKNALIGMSADKTAEVKDAELNAENIIEGENNR